LKAPKLSREEIEAMGGRFESADSINQQEEQSVAQGTLRAHMAALKDLGNVAESALSRVGETTLSSERVKDFTTFDRGITPETVGKVLKEKQLSIQEMQSQFAEATSPEVNIADANNINELETTANRDTGARNLLNMLTKARRGAVDILNTAKKEQTRASEKMTYLKAEMDRLSSTKTMFDAGKTQGIFEKFIKSALCHEGQLKGVYLG
jgi:ribosomal protein L16 Arg81 hydroxylase